MLSRRTSQLHQRSLQLQPKPNRMQRQSTPPRRHRQKPARSARQICAGQKLFLACTGQVLFSLQFHLAGEPSMLQCIPRVVSACLLVLLGISTITQAKRITTGPQVSETSGSGYRFNRGGWMFVHLEGTPAEIGFQHGQLLSAEIADLLNVMKIETRHDTKRDWNFYRETGRKMFWPHIDAEYQQELEGIAKGAQSKGAKLDVWDIVALNGSIELPSYYVPWLNKREKEMNAPHILPEGHCSAFIATGSYTKGGKIVAAHNNWSGYADGE